MSAWQHMPGIDCLMNQYREDTHAQFGNVRFVREVQSICNQLGRKRFLCEAYGAGGWDLRFEDMKRIADWLGVLGVNLFDEHLSYITLRGARKADHPQSFSYHEPWWDSYHVMEQYITRLSASMAMGQQRNHVLVIEPTTTAWMYQADSTQSDKLGRIGKSFFDLLMQLEQAQAEYDIGCEDVMARHGGVTDAAAGGSSEKVITVGQRAYDVVVLPPLTETLRDETMKQLEEYAAAGGRIVSCGPPPALVNGRASQRGSQLAKQAGWQQIDAATLASFILPTLDGDGCEIHRAEGDKGILFHQRRQLADGELLLLVNTSMDAPSQGVVQATARGAQRWDLFTGEVNDYPSVEEHGKLQFAFDIPPCGSLLVLLTKQLGKTGTVHENVTTPIESNSPMQIEPIGPNVLTIDYVDITAGGETQTNLYFYRANQLAWQKNGLPRDPWDSAVQYNDELISKTFPPDSGFEVTYRFNIEGQVPKPLFVVIERPDLYSITCNSQPISTPADSWWLDKAFGKIDISNVAQQGANQITLKAQPFTMYHEIASAYVLGDFSLRSDPSGFTIVPPTTLSVSTQMAHATDLEGVAWLTAGVGFQRPAGNNDEDDTTPSVTFDLGQPVDLAAIDVWNYNESGLPRRGVKKMEVLGAATLDGAGAWSSLGTFELAQAPGGPAGAKTAFAQRLPAKGKQIRYVKFKILANHSGVSYPAQAGTDDNAFVGLAEVRFRVAAGDGETKPVKSVKIQSVSSELVLPGGFDRRAIHLVDGSGLAEAPVGWNQQGMPFYAAGVSYRQSFKIDRPQGNYKVSVPHWYGSVAKVLVNGKLCGHLVSRPWEVDVSDAIQAGSNQVEVVVVGTLKNTLGPHHAGTTVGSAWPGMFQQGPVHGPPAGSAYHTIGYGLFEPFTLLHVIQ